MYQADLDLEAELRNLMRVLERSDLESEAAESESESEISPLRIARDLWVIGAQGGERNENKLADAIFYDRHPDWKGRALKNASLPLRQEWIEIRDNVVRPYLSNYPLQPAAPPAPPPPVAPATAWTREPFGYSQFANTLKYEPYNYTPATAAQNEYRKVGGFLPYYYRVDFIRAKVSISQDPHGVGNLVFRISGREFFESVESDELKRKAGEIMAGGLTTADEIVFEQDVIGLLGLGLTMIDLAQGLQNERMLGGTGPESDKWRAKQQLQFAFALVAEDLVRKPWGPLQFINNHDARSLAVELANRYAEFRPIWGTYSPYFDREQQLGLYGANPPVQQTTMGPAPGGY